MLELIRANSAHLVCVSAAIGFTLLARYPISSYRQRGWLMKQADIFSSFSTNAKRLYLERFLQEKPGVGQSNSVDEAAVSKRFLEIYNTRYGRQRFLWPLVLFDVVMLAAMFLLSEAGLSWISLVSHSGWQSIGSLPSLRPLVVIPEIAAAGIGGAYLWVVSDLMSRSRRLVLSPPDIFVSALRIAMAPAIATAMGQLVTHVVALPLAFAIGAFPLEAVRQMLRRYATDTLKLGVGVEEESTDQILNLDSVDHPTADRLLDADISTIAQLAYADPVQLCMRTGCGFDFIVDIISQALAWQYLGDRLDYLRSAGLRGAMEINDFMQDLCSANRETQALAKALLKVAPTLPKNSTDAKDPPRSMEPAEFLKACDEIANDPNTLFLVEFWSESKGGPGSIIPNYSQLLA